MLYFREKELAALKAFSKGSNKKAMAIYGRRRVGKTELVLHYMESASKGSVVYFQCAGHDYSKNLQDFKSVLSVYLPEDTIFKSLQTFKDTITYFGKNTRHKLIVIDEFPLLCKKNEDVTVEFQWIIDHGLSGLKIILLGSNMSFMKKQINDNEEPLYGRFDEMMEIVPFTFNEVHQLFSSFEDAVHVYAQTGGVAQYVMLYKEFRSVSAATSALFFQRNGRLLQEADNLLMQELRDSSTYVSILRALSGGDKDSGTIARMTMMDARSVFSYLNRLTDLGILSVVENSFSSKKREKRYHIQDTMFRFHYFFIDPNLSMITAMGDKSKKVILDERYTQYLGFVYEDIIRESCFAYGMEGLLPFIPRKVGKWWGNVMRDGEWQESEIDVIAYDDAHILYGECKYRNKKVGEKELTILREKSAFVPAKGRKPFYLLASKSGFTEGLEEENVILIHQI